MWRFLETIERKVGNRAAAVVKTGASELVAAMDAGEISVDAASVIARRPADEQHEIVALPAKDRAAKVRILPGSPVFPWAFARISRIVMMRETPQRDANVHGAVSRARHGGSLGVRRR